MTLHAITRGTGPHHFIALHGWGADHRAFAPILRRVPEDVTLHAIDQPGCGASAPPTVWTTEAIAAPIVDYIRALPTDRVTIVGACSGAVVGLFVALAIPDRLERLVLLDPFLEPPWYFAIFTWPVVGRLFYRSSFGNPIGRRLTNAAVGQDRSADLTAGFSRVNHVHAARYLEALIRTPRPDAVALAELDGRVDIAVGARTFGVVLRSVRRFVELYWTSTVVTTLEGVGHLPLLEAPRTVADRILWPTNPARRQAS